MLVKIADTVYNSEEQPILLVLGDDDKKNIGEMPKENSKYCTYPALQEFLGEEGMNKIMEWMILDTEKEAEKKDEK